MNLLCYAFTLGDGLSFNVLAAKLFGTGGAGLLVPKVNQYLHENHNSQYGVAHAEDAPEDTDCLGAPHELGGVVVALLMVVYITLHLKHFLIP